MQALMEDCATATIPRGEFGAVRSGDAHDGGIHTKSRISAKRSDPLGNKADDPLGNKADETKGLSWLQYG